MNNDEHKETLDPALVDHLEQELDAMRELVRREIGARLSAVELDARGAADASGWRGLWRRRSDWIAVLLLVGLLWNGWQLWTLRFVPAPSTEAARAAASLKKEATSSDVASSSRGTAESTGEAALDDTAASGIQSGEPDRAPAPSTTSVETTPIPMDLSDPLAQWRSYLSGNRARIPAWAASIASTPHDMSVAQRGRFERYGAEPATTIATNAMEFLGGAFEVAVRDAVTAPLTGAVDLVYQTNEYGAERLREAADGLGVGALLTDPLAVDSLKVRVAIAVAHLERLATAD